ncbi:MAG: DUF1365 family protein, partial [Acetobacteraceae bacterium]|nr:DUF1365 family protein [Acetobacteraceae bacterium]
MYASALYEGTVAHRRTRPKAHRLRYRVFSLLLDLDEIPALCARLRLLSHRRFNLFSFDERDHADGSGSSLRDWAESHLARAGIDLEGGPIRLLAMPRVLGYGHYCPEFSERTVPKCLTYNGFSTILGGVGLKLVAVCPTLVRGGLTHERR